MIGFPVNEPTQPSKIILALMVTTLFGLIPMFSLKADLIFDQIIQLMEISHDVTGIVYLVMSDNLKCNQSMFSIFHKQHDSASTCSVQHQITNKEYNELFLLYDPLDLLEKSPG